MLPFICLLIDHRWCQNVVRTSLRSKRFCAVREQRITGRWMEWVKEGEGKGEGREEGNACRQTPGFWKPPTRKQRCHAVINKPIKSSAFRRGSEQNKRSSHEWINKFFYCKFYFSNNFNNPFVGWIMENFKSNLSSKLEFKGRRENFTGLLICIICRNLSNNANGHFTLATLPLNLGSRGFKYPQYLGKKITIILTIIWIQIIFP